MLYGRPSYERPCIFNTRQGGHGEFMQLIYIFYLEGQYIICS